MQKKVCCFGDVECKKSFSFNFGYYDSEILIKLHDVSKFFVNLNYFQQKQVAFCKCEMNG